MIRETSKTELTGTKRQVWKAGRPVGAKRSRELARSQWSALISLIGGSCPERSFIEADVNDRVWSREAARPAAN
jgi:hypothetical protein